MIVINIRHKCGTSTIVWKKNFDKIWSFSTVHFSLKNDSFQSLLKDLILVWLKIPYIVLGVLGFFICFDRIFESQILRETTIKY